MNLPDVSGWVIRFPNAKDCSGRKKEGSPQTQPLPAEIMEEILDNPRSFFYCILFFPTLRFIMWYIIGF